MIPHPWESDRWCSRHGDKMIRTADWEFDTFSGRPVVSCFIYRCPQRGCNERTLSGVTVGSRDAAARLAGPAPTADELRRNAEAEARQDWLVPILITVGIVAFIVFTRSLQ